MTNRINFIQMTLRARYLNDEIKSSLFLHQMYRLQRVLNTIRGLCV